MIRETQEIFSDSVHAHFLRAVIMGISCSCPGAWQAGGSNGNSDHRDPIKPGALQNQAYAHTSGQQGKGDLSCLAPSQIPWIGWYAHKNPRSRRVKLNRFWCSQKFMSRRRISVLVGIFFFFSFFRSAPATYKRSQARGKIGAAAAGLHHSRSNAGSELHLQPMPQLMATPEP